MSSLQLAARAVAELAAAVACHTPIEPCELPAVHELEVPVSACAACRTRWYAEKAFAASQEVAR